MNHDTLKTALDALISRADTLASNAAPHGMIVDVPWWLGPALLVGVVAVVGLVALFSSWAWRGFP
ncbi:MAG: hypothetical protein HY962_07180 [Ignavibacteriae bacterium]|nr:hypothetical protein [Ignavibacteriota bacterium]